MRWSPPQSLAVALAGLTLGALPWTASPLAHGQDPPPPAAAAPDADLAKRVEELDGVINRHLAAGQIAEAVPPAREKLDLLARIRGQDHWQTGDARRNLETYSRLAGRPREVQERFVKARQANARANQLDSRGQFAEAALLWQETLAIRRDILGEGHPDTAASYNNLAETLRAQGKYAEAERLLRGLLDRQRAKPPAYHPAVAGTLATLGPILLDQRKWSEAEPVLRECLAIRQEAQPDEWSTFDTRSQLGGSLLGQGRFAEAEPLLVTGYEGMKAREARIPAQGRPRLAAAARRVVELYEAWGKADKAAEWRAKFGSVELPADVFAQ